MTEPASSDPPHPQARGRVGWVVLIVLGVVLLVRLVVSTAQWTQCTGDGGSGFLLAVQHLGGPPSATDCLLYALSRPVTPTTVPATVPPPATDPPPPPTSSPYEVAVAECGALHDAKVEQAERAYDRAVKAYEKQDAALDPTAEPSAAWKRALAAHDAALEAYDAAVAARDKCIDQRS